MAEQDCATAILARLNDGEKITLSDDLCVNCQAVWNAVWNVVWGGSGGTITLGELRAQFPCVADKTVDETWTAAP